MIQDPCRECAGGGRVEKVRKVGLSVPAGVDTGTRLRRAGEGEHGRRNGPPGDLYIDVVVLADEQLERLGADVASTVSLSYPEAVLGATVEVETLHGTESLEIPAGTRHGSEFRLRGKGIPRLGRRGHGDHLARIELEVPHPRDLDDERIEQLQSWAEEDGSQVRERRVLDRVRDLFG